MKIYKILKRKLKKKNEHGNLPLLEAFKAICLAGGLFTNSNIIHYKELSVYGAHTSKSFQNKKVIDWISIGNLEMKKYITSVYPLNEIEKAFKAIKSGDVLKAIIKA